MSPNQLRVNDVQGEEAPKHLTKGKSSNSTTFPEEQASINLSMHGRLSYFTVCTPIQHEIDYCLTLMATAENVEWNPYLETFSQLDQAYYSSICIPLN